MPRRWWCEVFSSSVVSDSFTTPWAAAHQAPLSTGFSRQEYWNRIAFSFSRGSSRPRDQIQVSCIADRFFIIWATREAPLRSYLVPKPRDSKWTINFTQLWLEASGLCSCPLSLALCFTFFSSPTPQVLQVLTPIWHFPLWPTPVPPGVPLYSRPWQSIHCNGQPTELASFKQTIMLPFKNSSGELPWWCSA